ncbi:hypothetical protein FHW89_002500 [Mucilaginibacter sp. SG564]|nr:hypothetical protein [Mucilaginibacter sp. SG564]
MEKLIIGYAFVFTLSIRKLNGKIDKGHRITGLG